MNSEQIRIPTILGLATLLVGLSVGVFMVTKQQTFESQAGTTLAPKGVEIVNVTSNSAAVLWQTDQPASGFVKLGVKGDSFLPTSFSDERDSVSPAPHSLHFVSLKNLNPDTNYQFKIYSNNQLFPEKDYYSIKTAPDLPSLPNTPLRGTILTSQLQPVTEAIITLEIPEVSKMATITKVAGNFIMPLSDIYNQSLTEKVDLKKLTANAKIKVYDGTSDSDINLALPLSGETLEQIILGQDRDFTKVLKPPLPPNSPEALKYDLDGDNLLTSLDFSIVLVNLGKNPKDKRADLNKDGVVDEKDLGLIRSFLPKNSILSPTPLPAADG